jgi:hypothetical protein
MGTTTTVGVPQCQTCRKFRTFLRAAIQGRESGFGGELYARESRYRALDGSRLDAEGSESGGYRIAALGSFDNVRRTASRPFIKACAVLEDRLISAWDTRAARLSSCEFPAHHVVNYFGLDCQGHGRGSHFFSCSGQLVYFVSRCSRDRNGLVVCAHRRPKGHEIRVEYDHFGGNLITRHECCDSSSNVANVRQLWLSFSYQAQAA